MTREEVKALGLRVGDVMRFTAEATISDIDDEYDIGDSHERDGPLVTFANNRGSFWPEDLESMERVMPPLPDGWTWEAAPSRYGKDTVAAAEFADGAAKINRGGYIEAWCIGDDEREVYDFPIPALVAKALLEAWGRTQ